MHFKAMVYYGLEKAGPKMPKHRIGSCDQKLDNMKG